MNCKSISKTEWRNETATSNRLFAEADRLNEIAYGLLNDRPTTAATIKQFQKAKNAANAKYEEAHLSWKIAKQHLVDDVKSVLTDANIDVYEPEKTTFKKEPRTRKNDSNG